jgi:hypothetical protein
MSTIEEVDAATKAVAEQLGLPHTLEADMGGDACLQIDLGARGGPDWPADRAMIVPDEPGATWWFDVEGGAASIDSGLTIDTDPAQVAAWIRAQAAQHASPAWITAQRELVDAGYAQPASESSSMESSRDDAMRVLQQIQHDSHAHYQNNIEF